MQLELTNEEKVALNRVLRFRLYKLSRFIKNSKNFELLREVKSEKDVLDSITVKLNSKQNIARDCSDRLHEA